MPGILIADDEPILRMDLSAMLADLGYSVVGEAGDGFDAVELCRLHHPDVVLMDVKMPVFDGLTAADTILREDLARCVILLTAYNDTAIIDRASSVGVTGYLVKPIDRRLLRPTIEVALAQSERLRVSRQETAQARQQLSDSRLIQQAQGILARQEQITESEAYQLLRRLSMDKRTPITALAKAVIEQKRHLDELAAEKKQPAKERHCSDEAAGRIRQKAKHE